MVRFAEDINGRTAPAIKIALHCWGMCGAGFMHCEVNVAGSLVRHDFLLWRSRPPLELWIAFHGKTSAFSFLRLY